jgi:succinate dehydrogenase / fumarate reductase membrane anchor subunit
MSLRTPLGRVLGHGSAKDGTGHFFAQRLSGTALALLGGWFAWCLAVTTDFAHAAVLAEISRPVNVVLLLLLSLVLAWHSYLGIQVVIEDYVHRAGRKLIALVVSRFVHILLAVAAVYAILKIGLGA